MSHSILSKFRNDLRAIVHAVISATDASSLVEKTISQDGDCLLIEGDAIDLSSAGRLTVISGGKAAVGMASAAERLLGGLIDGGLVCPPHGITPVFSRVRVLGGAHPYPNDTSVAAAQAALDLAGSLRDNDLLLALVSGGLSSIWCSPGEGMTLDAKRKVSELLVSCGATIDEVNTVRKHFSRIKGGRLAEAAHPARVVTLAISDVVGDNPSSIGSGPTQPDPTTYQDALAVIDTYELGEDMPASAMRAIDQGISGALLETPKPGDRSFESDVFKVIASNRTAIDAAALAGRTLGYEVRELEKPIVGESRDAALSLCSLAQDYLRSRGESAQPLLLIGGGETTVSVKGTGRGGRNQEMVLSAAIRLEQTSEVLFASFGTDGIDGCTSAAGAFADSATAQNAASAGIDLKRYLDNNDSYSVFKELGGLIETGPTGTNVGDVQMIFIV